MGEKLFQSPLFDKYNPKLRNKRRFTYAVAVQATKNWVGKTSRTKLYLKDIVNLITSFSWLKKRILDTDGHMTNCTKNNLQKESNYDCRAYPSAVGHVINFA